jgi:hypothetical protein
MYYMPNKDWKLNDVTYSPFKVENHPSFLIGNKYGNLSHIAFNDTSKRGDCFSFVKQLYNLTNLDEVLRKIDGDFQLGLGNGVKGDYKVITSQYKQPEITKRNSLIQVITRKFLKEELAYWNEYHQDLQDLRDNNVYSIKTLYFNKQKFPLKDTDLRFGYYYPKGGFWKLYIPFAKNKKNKWLGNVPLQTSWGLENLNKEYNTLIVKSLKDYLVCKKVCPYIFGVQNESLAAFSGETIDYTKEHSKEVFYGGDSDEPGKKASYLITSTLGYRHINPPDHLKNECCKDFADMGKIKGLDSLKQHFVSKNLLSL